MKNGILKKVVENINLNYANNTRYIGKRETPGTNVSVDYHQHLDVEVLEAESDYILVRLIGTYPSTYPFNDTNKSRTGNQKYYLGEYMRADDTTYNSYTNSWPYGSIPQIITILVLIVLL